MILADALVFGGGNYYGTLNAFGHAFWERTFSLRHNCAFPLAGKLGIAVGLDRDQEKKEATSFIEMMMRSNHMAVITTFNLLVDDIQPPGQGRTFPIGYFLKKASASFSPARSESPVLPSSRS